MKTRQKTKFIAIGLSVLLLAGCSENAAKENNTTTTTAATMTTAATSPEKTDTDEKTTTFTGPFGETVDTTKGEYKGGTVLCYFDGYAYFSLDGGDIKEYKEGDTINGIKLVDANITYATLVSDGTANIEDTRAEFEGEFTVKGYIRANVTDEYVDKSEAPGMILFVPDKEEWASFPDLRRTTRTDDFGFWDTGKGVPGFSLGLLSDYETDLSAIPSDGSEAYVEITLDNLFLIKSDNDIYNTAKIVSVKAAE